MNNKSADSSFPGVKPNLPQESDPDYTGINTVLLGNKIPSGIETYASWRGKCFPLAICSEIKVNDSSHKL